jgi:hypothetical protein
MPNWLKKEMDQRGAIPSCTQLMHASAYPEAQQLAIYVGRLLHKTLGGIVPGAFFVIPSRQAFFRYELKN